MSFVSPLSEPLTPDAIRTSLAQLPGPDLDAAGAVRRRDAELTKPPGSLGRLEDLAVWLGSWQGRPVPRVETLRMRIFAGSHGVTRRGVSAFPAEVTGQMLANFRSGGAAINQLCALHGVDLEVLDLGWEAPTADFSCGPAMTAERMLEAFGRGMAAVHADTDVLGIGEMGIGNTTSASAIYAALWGGGPEAWVGRGTGVDDEGLARKVTTVDDALAAHTGHLGDPLEVLRRLGGVEIAGMAGAILAARLRRVPVVLDGFVATAAAAVLHALDDTALDHCLAAHVSAETAHRAALAALGLEPMLDLGLRLGEGSGAALALGVIKAAAVTHTGMATFAEAGVTAG